MNIINNHLSEEVMVDVVLLAELVYHLEELFICFYLFAVYVYALNIFAELYWAVDLDLFVCGCAT